MGLDFQDSNVMLASVHPASRSKKTRSARRAGRVHSSARRFADLLAQDEEPDSDAGLPEVLRGLPSLMRKLPLDPAVYMQRLYGRMFDPATGQVNHVAFLERTQDKTGRFAQMFVQALGAAGIDADQPVTLVVNDLGQVEAHDHPQATVITGLFTGDRDLSQSYRDVAEAHHWATLTEVGSAYVETWYGTENHDEREDISDQFRRVFDALADCSSRMTCHAGNLDSASLSTALAAMDALGRESPAKE